MVPPSSGAKVISTVKAPGGSRSEPAWPHPMASFDTAKGYRAMARQAGAAVTSFHVRFQLSDGDRVCSVVDWTMQPVPGTLSAAEVLEIRDGQIVRGELFYDAEELRKAMAQGPTG